MGEFNPGFSFDAGLSAAPAQAPWEFGGEECCCLTLDAARKGVCAVTAHST
jgi:hypothetical protein